MTTATSEDDVASEDDVVVEVNEEMRHSDLPLSRVFQTRPSWTRVLKYQCSCTGAKEKKRYRRELVKVQQGYTIWRQWMGFTEDTEAARELFIERALYAQDMASKETKVSGAVVVWLVLVVNMAAVTFVAPVVREMLGIGV